MSNAQVHEVTSPRSPQFLASLHAQVLKRRSRSVQDDTLEQACERFDKLAAMMQVDTPLNYLSDFEKSGGEEVCLCINEEERTNYYLSLSHDDYHGVSCSFIKV